VRAKSPDDGRVTLVALTPKGHETISRAFGKHEAALEEAVTNLDANERTELIRLLKKLGAVAGKEE
jgi:DNA-binding MarR family transcriptional regulator